MIGVKTWKHHTSSLNVLSTNPINKNTENLHNGRRCKKGNQPEDAEVEGINPSGSPTNLDPNKINGGRSRSARIAP